MRTLLLLRGSPGCGKSTWIEKHGLKQYALSPDEIRLMYAAPCLLSTGDVGISQKNDEAVWKTLFQLLEFRMANGEFTVIDATCSKTADINQYKNLCDKYRYRIYIVDFTDVPLDEVKRSNRLRPSYKQVPEEVIDNMYARFATQKIPSGVTSIRADELDQIWLKKINFDHWKKIHIIGDIHGCFTTLQQYLTDVNDDELYIFCGDYIDRGNENASMVNWLLENYNRENVLLLEGNHERWLREWANGEVCASQQFELHTKVELENAGINKKEVRKMMRRVIQCAYFDFSGNTYLVTHGGLSTLPDNLTLVSTSQMIRGVGNYSEHNDVDETFSLTTPDNVYQIHGHRNVSDVETNVPDTRCYNLDGHVEFGGYLRCLQLLPDGSRRTVEILNTSYTKPETVPTTPEAQDLAQRILAMRRSRYIQEKQFGNISSFNFTREAFGDKVWDSKTTVARGLYINIPKVKIVARAYDKFFNVGEMEETRLDTLSRTMQFPATAYVKENGFLGIAAYNDEDDSLLMTTKSSITGDAAIIFQDNMQSIYGNEVMERIKTFSKEHNCSFVFECVDPDRDPHIIKYQENRLYLLDIIFNEIPFRKFSYEELVKIAGEVGITRCKELAFRFDDWQEFYRWYTEVISDGYVYNDKIIEGFVVEDSTGFMVKIKLAYYKFWKSMRNVADEAISNGYIRKTSKLITPLANYFYAWVKTLHDSPDRQTMRKDIITLRDRFFTEKCLIS